MKSDPHQRFGSPLRYPGGKQRLAPYIRKVLIANDLVGGEYAEPYAGGAGVAIRLLLDREVSRIHLNDISNPIYCFWRAILEETNRFCDLVASIPLTVDEWKSQRLTLQGASDSYSFEVGFSTFYLNRCNRSGILNGGLIGGLSQEGDWLMDARFPRRNLIGRIETIAKRSADIVVTSLDAEDFIRLMSDQLAAKSLVYCDPPYFHKADRLYLDHYNSGDHERLAQTIRTELSRPWVVSYDSTDEIKAFYTGLKSAEYQLRYSASSSSLGKEIIFFADSLQIPSVDITTSQGSLLAMPI